MQAQDYKQHLNKTSHAVRASQAVLQYGVGAMVDFPDQTLMTAAPESWTSDNGILQVDKINDERLENLLNVDYFGIPASKDDKGIFDGISYVRFPEWYFCPKCRKFQPLSKWIKDYQNSPSCARSAENDPYMVKHMKCPTCKQELVVARIITVCSRGHISDFPWVEWVHCQAKPQKTICGNPDLRIYTSATSSEGLEGIQLECKGCGAKATLAGAFTKDKFCKLEKDNGARYNFRCNGLHPWKHVKDGCMEFPKVMQRGSSSVYFPVTESSLVIPPYSSILAEKIQKTVNFEEFQKAKQYKIDAIKDFIKYVPEEERPQKISEAIKGVITEYSEKIASDISVSSSEVEKYLIQRSGKSESSQYTTSSEEYRFQEYEALTGKKSFEIEKYRDFKRESTDIVNYKIPFIANISLINKIREIQVLTGFSRISPSDKTLPISKQTSVVCVKEEKTRWYPAYQVHGEGIFIEFDENAISDWEQAFAKDITPRVKKLNANYRNSYLGKNTNREITAKFLLLHTISHLLLKQLSFECGYNIASLKERIYCNTKDLANKMAGIFIYTANGDSEGTMGGLVRQGRLDLFPKLFKKAIESASVCSNDPVCSISTGQGRESLNLSACYSCTLVPETSCEEFNIFLDRSMVVGTIDNPEFGFYSKALKDGWNVDLAFDDVKEKPSDSAATKPEEKYIIINRESGTDESELSFEDIFDYFSQFCDGEMEKKNLTELVNCASEFENKEKPYKECEFSFLGEDEIYKADLVWKESKVMVFTRDNEDSFNACKTSDWNCFFTGNDKFSTKDLLKTLREV